MFTELGRVEQWSAWRAHIPKVDGSSPSPAPFECGAMALCLCPPCNVKALCAIRSTEGFSFELAIVITIENSSGWAWTLLVTIKCFGVISSAKISRGIISFNRMPTGIISFNKTLMGLPEFLKDPDLFSDHPAISYIPT